MASFVSFSRESTVKVCHSLKRGLSWLFPRYSFSSVVMGAQVSAMLSSCIYHTYQKLYGESDECKTKEIFMVANVVGYLFFCIKAQRHERIATVVHERWPGVGFIRPYESNSGYKEEPSVMTLVPCLECGDPPPVLIWALYHHYANAEDVTALLDAGVYINDADAMGRTALMEAACLNKPQLVKIFIRRGAVVNQVDSAGNSALWYACTKESKGSLFPLLNAGASLEEIEEERDKFSYSIQNELRRFETMLLVLSRLNVRPVATIVTQYGHGF